MAAIEYLDPTEPGVVSVITLMTGCERAHDLAHAATATQAAQLALSAAHRNLKQAKANERRAKKKLMAFVLEGDQ